MLSRMGCYGTLLGVALGEDFQAARALKAALIYWRAT